ncbi:hypothetical protein CRENBAI_006222 [Crenichthys baileyi]|uniref:GP-PDE domain-containing protein n=1 Tax=Crenichthys baileyi TaxID=28760 RepID=A0AAV9RVG7_9TELE
MTPDSWCRVCSRGFFSCHWKRLSNSEAKFSCCWYSVVSVGTLLSLFWMYICLVVYNDQYDFNSEAFIKLHKHFNYFMVLMIISAVFACYCVLLLLFALVQVALGEKLHLHWLHRIFICLGVIFIALGITGIIQCWKDEWLIVPFSLQYTAPFLQFGAVGALTLLSWFVFQAFLKAKEGSKFLIAVVFLVVSAFILLWPLVIHSPCLIDFKDLKAKPDLFGHRGAPMLAPENTLMSFERSATECNVKAFETDVQLSKDRIPFLMHDHKSEFLKRTTNITKNVSCGNQLNFDELKTLNAGEWFVEKDPFHTVHLLTENQKNTAKMQAIPSLRELLELAKQNNTKVIFDLYHPKNCDDINDTVDTVNTILASGIDQKLIYWLPPKNREYVKNASDFIQVYGNESEMFQENGSHLNVKYSQLTMDKIR